MAGTLNILKLSVGTKSVEGLEKWQRGKRAQGGDGMPRHVTRMWPKRAEELLDGGSIFWVIQGVVLARQRILRLDEVRRADGVRRCGLVLEPKLIRTEAQPRRPFQGWRYLPGSEAPRDLPEGRQDEPSLPPKLLEVLAEIGVR